MVRQTQYCTCTVCGAGAARSARGIGNTAPYKYMYVITEPKAGLQKTMYARCAAPFHKHSRGAGTRTRKSAVQNANQAARREQIMAASLDHPQ
jgi:hypothetical protein